VIITEVRIKLCEENNSERLLAFCSVTFDNAFVVRDLKIIEGTKGIFVAMPSRKLTDRCNRCMCKNHLRARFCNSCGARLDENRATRSMDGRAKLHADIAHPIHSAARELVQNAVVKAFGEERERAKLPGYVCTYDDFDGGDFDETPMSYGAMVSEGAKPGFKPHSPHATPKGTHFNTSDAPVAKARTASENSFGDGIL
jgi:stage V sporulation protein G